MAIKKDSKIEKLNVLNEMRSNSMTLQEIRFLTIYLSKINARQPDTKVVRFPLNDFKKIMELGRLNTSNIKANTLRLLQKVVTVPNENGGYNQFQLFKEIIVDKDKNDEWYVEIDSHDKALPLFFEFKSKYFTYELWNALRLSSANQIRIYEILKQYEKVGERTITVEELRELLYIEKGQYPRFNNLKIRVLDTAQQELLEHTDIYFDYELIKKGAKVISIRFIINKNKNYIDQLTLDEFILNQKEVACDEEPNGINFSFFADAFDKEFDIDQVKELYQLSFPIVDSQNIHNDFDLKMYDYMLLKFRQLNAKKDVKHRYGYLKKLIDLDVQKLL